MERKSWKIFKSSLAVPEKWFCICQANFAFLSLLSNIQSHKRFHVRFWQIPGQGYRNLQHGKKSFKVSLPEKNGFFPEKNGFVFVKQI